MNEIFKSIPNFNINDSFKIVIPLKDSNFNSLNYFNKHSEQNFDGITRNGYTAFVSKCNYLLRQLKSKDNIIAALENENSQLGQDMAILKLENCRLQSQIAHLTQTPRKYSQQIFKAMPDISSPSTVNP